MNFVIIHLSYIYHTLSKVFVFSSEFASASGDLGWDGRTEVHLFDSQAKKFNSANKSSVVLRHEFIHVQRAVFVSSMKWQFCKSRVFVQFLVKFLLVLSLSSKDSTIWCSHPDSSANPMVSCWQLWSWLTDASLGWGCLELFFKPLPELLHSSRWHNTIIHGSLWTLLGVVISNPHHPFCFSISIDLIWCWVNHNRGFLSTSMRNVVLSHTHLHVLMCFLHMYFFTMVCHWCLFHNSMCIVGSVIVGDPNTSFNKSLNTTFVIFRWIPLWNLFTNSPLVLLVKTWLPINSMVCLSWCWIDSLVRGKSVIFSDTYTPISKTYLRLRENMCLCDIFIKIAACF